MARKAAAAPNQKPASDAPAAPAPDLATTTPPIEPQPPADDKSAPPEPLAASGEQTDKPDSAGAEVDQVEQPADIKTAAPAPEVTEPLPELDDYIVTHEKAAQAVDLVVTAISYPGAKPRHHPGVYSGFPITDGPLQATYNDGSTH